MMMILRRCLLQQQSRVAQRCVSTSSLQIPKDGLTLTDFIRSSDPSQNDLQNGLHVAPAEDAHTFHIKTYGCQMNVSDSDIVRALLLQSGLREVNTEKEAQVLLTNTCAIRENAEQKVWHRLRDLKAGNKKAKQRAAQVVGVLGCMAERLKHDLLQDGLADLVVGPDAYRDLPRLIQVLLDEDEETAVNVQLSLEETYADVRPVRRNPGDVSAFSSIMRGCNNMCSYCVVPFTRGRERSRPFDSIVGEIEHLLEEGIKEVVLLGQNVNSYHDKSEAALLAQPQSSYHTSNEGFSNLYRLRGGTGYYFSDLVEAVSDLDPELRVRFTSPHPKDYPPELLQLMTERSNVCSQLHMPAQSGNTEVLERMRRGYSREAYLQLIDDVRTTIPDVAISSDFIAGFCGETEEEHADTLSLMKTIAYDQAYMFAYSMRGKTHAHRSMVDDVAADVKQRRLQEVIDVFRTGVQERNEQVEVGRLRLVLLEGESKRSTPDNPAWSGRTDQNKRIIFPDGPCSDRASGTADGGVDVRLQRGDYGVVEVTEARGHTLRGRLLWRTTLQEFSRLTPEDEIRLKALHTVRP
jgi:MiaB/RimO family radical SAM methylthiotransferase